MSLADCVERWADALVNADGHATDASAFARLVRDIRSLQSEPNGWNAIVVPALLDAAATPHGGRGTVWNVSGADAADAAELAIWLPELVAYALDAPETIVVTLPLL